MRRRASSPAQDERRNEREPEQCDENGEGALKRRRHRDLTRGAAAALVLLVLPPAALVRPTISRCENPTPGNSASFCCADPEAGTHVRPSSEGRSPNTGGAAELQA